MKRSELIDLIAEHMMVETRGYKRGEWPIEFDKTRDDSQISMVIEDVEAVLSFLEENHGYKFETEPLTYTATTNNVYYGSGGAVGGSGYIYATTTFPPVPVPEPDIEGVQTDVDIRIRTRKNPSLSELREFLERIELLGCEADTEVVGSLSFTRRLEDTMVQQISCGDCGENDIFVNDHSCKY